MIHSNSFIFISGTTAVQRASIADSSVARLPALVPEKAGIEGEVHENEDIVKMVKLRPSG